MNVVKHNNNITYEQQKRNIILFLFQFVFSIQHTSSHNLEKQTGERHITKKLKHIHTDYKL